MPLDEFAAKHVFAPLGMSETGFRPAEKLRGRIAPTEKVGDGWLRGEVHDPRARAMGGVAGHAGVFSTADDLVKFARMMLRGGELDGKRVLAPATVRTMTTARPVPGGLRALGWDVARATGQPRRVVRATRASVTPDSQARRSGVIRRTTPR
jgi:CubicO group peptidase (beta-lactamase class C family)